MKLRISVNIPGGVMAAYVDPETKQSVKVKRLYYDRSIEVDDYDALHLRGQNKGKILTEEEWNAEFKPSELRPNLETFDKESLTQYILDNSISGLESLYSIKELRSMASELGVKIPSSLKKKTLVAKALKDIAAESVKAEEKND